MANLFPQTRGCPKCGHPYFAKEHVVSFTADPVSSIGLREVEMDRNSYRCLNCGHISTTIEIEEGAHRR